VIHCSYSLEIENELPGLWVLEAHVMIDNDIPDKPDLRDEIEEVRNWSGVLAGRIQARVRHKVSNRVDCGSLYSLAALLTSSESNPIRAGIKKAEYSTRSIVVMVQEKPREEFGSIASPARMNLQK
jgi:hypothetical protein